MSSRKLCHQSCLRTSALFKIERRLTKSSYLKHRSLHFLNPSRSLVTVVNHANYLCYLCNNIIGKTIGLEAPNRLRKTTLSSPSLPPIGYARWISDGVQTHNQGDKLSLCGRHFEQRRYISRRTKDATSITLGNFQSEPQDILKTYTEPKKKRRTRDLCDTRHEEREGDPDHLSEVSSPSHSVTDNSSAILQTESQHDQVDADIPPWERLPTLRTSVPMKERRILQRQTSPEQEISPKAPEPNLERPPIRRQRLAKTLFRRYKDVVQNTRTKQETPAEETPSSSFLQKDLPLDQHKFGQPVPFVRLALPKRLKPKKDRPPQKPLTKFRGSAIQKQILPQESGTARKDRNKLENPNPERKPLKCIHLNLGRSRSSIVRVEKTNRDGTLRVTSGWEEKYRQLRLFHHSVAGNLAHLQKAFELDYKQAKSIINTTKTRSLTEYLKGLFWEERRMKVQRLLLGSMVASANQTLFVLSNIGTLKDDFHIRLQCLRYLYRAFKHDVERDIAMSEQFRGQIFACINGDNWPEKEMAPGHLSFLLARLTPEEAEGLLERYLQHYKARPAQFLLEVTSYYAKLSQTKSAQEWLERLESDSMQSLDEQGLGFCKEILLQDTVSLGENGPGFQYLPILLKKGLSPTPAMHTAIIESALDAGYHNVAWDLYRYLKSSGHQLDPHAHLLLLRHSFLHKDSSGVSEIMSVIHAEKDLYTNEFILGYAMNMVRVVCLFEQASSVAEALSHILALYDRAFNRRSLTKLGVLDSTSQCGASDNLPTPKPDMLAFTMWSYILCHRDHSGVDKLWSKIKALAADGDRQVIQMLSSTDVVYSALLLFYCRRDSTIVQALEVLSFMLSRQYCLPSARSWSILVCGLLKHDRVAQAQKVVEMMNQHNFALTDIGEDYIPAGYTINDLRRIPEEQNTVLDEQLPLHSHTLSNPSSHSLDQGQQDTNRSEEETDLWKNMVEMYTKRNVNAQGNSP